MLEDHSKTKLELGNLVNLETLECFSTKHGRVTDLKGMTRLRSLSIYIGDQRYTMETLSSSLSKLSDLESLTIDNYDGFYTPTNDDEEGFVWDFFNLKQLNLEIYMPRLPDAQRFPSHLKTIELAYCCLTEDPMPILEKLLHLKEIRLWSKSFCGRRMDCSRDGFPQLQKLRFDGLEEWEEWIVEEGSMPLLCTLWIYGCRKLKEIPDGLRFITNLEDLIVYDVGDEFDLRLSEGYLLSHLTTISLSRCRLTEDPMPILEKLLHLKEISLLDRSFSGRRMVCSRDGFPQLQKLKFYGLKEWEEWIVEEGSMPLLYTLDIWSCRELKEIPFRFITSLHDLAVGQSSIRLLETCLPSFLTTISLIDFRLTEDQMMILEKLLHLKDVQLNRCFCGGRMVCSRGGFPQLKNLKFKRLEEWEEWIIEEGSMPLLHTLKIDSCPKLKELPDGLRFITSLKSLTCCYMGKGWEKRLSKGGKDYYKVQHIPSWQTDILQLKRTRTHEEWMTRRLMAELAVALLPFAVERLWNLLVRETEQFQGVEEQFKGLKNDVETLRCFLKDAEAKKHSSAMVRKVIKDIKEIVFDAEDIIETFLLKKELGESSSSSFKRFAYVTVKRMGLGFVMKPISKRISKVILDMQNLGVQKVIVNEEYMQSLLVKEKEMRQTFPTSDEDHLVGLERSMMEGELLKEIVRVLETQKALIVIDDIWREGDWDLIKHVFLPKKGWKVLLTSRNEEVALHADRQCVTFKPECLTFEESWDVFQRIAFPIKDTSEFKIDEDMKQIGMEMIKHCGGLPLAIKVLGGMLRDKYTLHQWKTIHENIKAHIVRGSGSDDRNVKLQVYDVLHLSFEELPAYLKHCFLYLASFPEDYKIDVESLSYYWAAEGILRPMDFDGASIREVVDGYIEELVKRNMVISKRDVDTSRFKTLQLHDMMREVCLRKAEEENFVQTICRSTANSRSPCKSRRLAVVRRPGETFNVDTEVKNPSLRTLLFIKNGELKATSLFFTSHKLMRVLDLSWAMFEGGKVRSSIGKLIHLRYLNLEMSIVNQLPSSMRNLKKLLYLNLAVYDEVYIPNILKEMQELTFLWLPWRLHDKTKLELKNLVKLETMKNFNTKHGRVTDLQGMTRLRSLSIFITDERYTMETLSSSLSKLSHLKSLTIYNNKEFYTPTNDDEEGFVWDFVNLKQLKLEIYMPRLPDAQRFPSHLTTISLKQSRLKEDPMPILEKLLHLKETSLRDQSFCGRRMVCSRDGFPQLQKLKFDGLKEWEEWIIEEGSMPLLHTLEIGSCPRLKELPDGLQFITNLEDLRVNYMGDEFTLKLLEGYLPSHLTTIELTYCCLKEDPMPILEKLLHLKEISLKSKSFSGRRMVCSRDGFPQLQKLLFMGLLEWEEWIVEEGSMPLLHTLDIWSCRELKEIPDGLRFITSLHNLIVGESSIRLSETCLPSFLTTISLIDFRLTEDQMMILEKLLHLKDVQLNRCFCGGRMVCSRGGFPQLQNLEFKRLEEWEEWIVEEGSMPLLHTLNIESCPKLKELPDGLRFITSLKSLTFYNMGKRWEKRLANGGKDYYKVQHIPSVKFMANRDFTSEIYWHTDAVKLFDEVSN
ncbi:hypothetical protein IGI04_008455 [Brassica rapa subsp. trilocularis]|uniref:Disease resistance protein n=1 Tax=Brassica rapa subsp. trilocularis TaxID=1813537 RepID=A0ABQ7NNT0_BRACM|nr:hypothetical protein IGI04_008455 [Brassica rapa subsp. trilocularis]